MHFVRREFRFPEALDRALQRHFWGGHVPSARELGGLQRALEQLWPLLAKGRGQSGGGGAGHYSGQAELADAYAAYYLPANALKLSLVLEEALLFGLPLTAAADGNPLRWLDVGSGPGTAFWGLAWWAAHRGVDFEFCGLEQSPAFLKVAGALAGTLLGEPDLRTRARKVRWENFKHGKSGGPTLLELLRQNKPHVVSMMNSIGEMAPDVPARGRWLEEVVDELARQSANESAPRWLVLVEPGSQAASRELLELRNSLRGAAQVRVWLPCLDDRLCGALLRPDDWCHEEAAVTFPGWMAELGAGAGLKKESLLFSYLVLSIGEHPAPPSRWPDSGARVVSQMMREKGLTQCFLCTREGKRKARVLNSRVTEKNAAFTSSIRGQVFSSIELDEKNDVREFENFGGENPGLVALDPTVFPPLR